MSWNHRVMRENQPGEEEFFGIHEVYYERDGETVRNWTKYPTAVCAETVEGLRWMLERMLAALDQPVLEQERDE